MPALSATVHSFVRRAASLQVLVLAGFWLVGEQIVRFLGLPIPGGVVGMTLLLVLLSVGWVKPASVRLGAYWLLAEMLLFFVPAVIGIIDHGEFAGALGLKIALVILVGTTLVMAGTALTVDLLYRWKQRHAVG